MDRYITEHVLLPYVHIVQMWCSMIGSNIITITFISILISTLLCSLTGLSRDLDDGISGSCMITVFLILLVAGLPIWLPIVLWILLVQLLLFLRDIIEMIR